MKKRYKKFTQTDFANLFTKIDQSGVSKLLKGSIKVSSPLAFELADIFPNKTAQEWKHATKEDLNHLFNELKEAA